MEPSVLSVYMVSSDSLALIQVQGIAGPEGSRGLNCVMEMSGMDACECVWRRNNWEKVSMVSCVILVLMQGLGITGPTTGARGTDPPPFLAHLAIGHVSFCHG